MEKRETIFGFRVSDTERRAIKTLAEGLQRTESDAVRLVVQEAARIIQDSGKPSAREESECQA